MSRPTRRLRLALSLVVAIGGFAAGAALGSSLLALVGCAGLIATLLSVERIPRSRD